MRAKLLVVLLASVMAACAGLDAGTVTDDGKESGIRYYETSPFLLMYTDGKGGLKTELLYLPDTSKLRVIKPYAYLAKNDMTLKFENGRMTQAKSVVDETIIPTQVLQSLEKIAISKYKAANAQATTIPGPYIFRIERSDDTWKLVGGQALDVDGNTGARINFTAP